MNRNKCRGMSLISTLVGMVIAMNAVTGMMVAYKNTLSVVIPATRNAESDGQRVLGLLRANKVLQAAGFGITAPAYAIDVVVLSGATLTGSTLSGTSQFGSTTVGNAIVWAVDTGGGYTCEGLLAGISGGLLRLLPVSCSSATQWGALNWAIETIVDDTRSISITLASQECTPFGVAEDTEGAAVGERTVTLSTTMSTQDSNNAYADVPVSLTTCLANFH